MLNSYIDLGKSMGEGMGGRNRSLSPGEAEEEGKGLENYVLWNNLISKRLRRCLELI